ncbi:S41 family peptidase [Alkaliflexus imshenetskii]|uniref:S41 family peptidase n=1 Tax=Alkaliflexus imshenetskii TaxID=286730 RepID=UPI000479B2D6|nr:S41 family peptidase [Alkaliflexus imshenetskii]
MISYIIYEFQKYIKKTILYIFIVVCFSSCQSKRLVFSEIEADLDYLKQKIEEIHPDPYWYLSENQFDSLIYSVKRNFFEKGRISQKRFYQQLNPVIAELQDGHTRLRVPSSIMLRAFFWGSRIMPVAFKIEGQELYLRADLRKKELFDKSDRVVAINGIPTSEIVERLLANNYGFNFSFRVHQLNETSITRDLWLYYDMNRYFFVDAVNSEGEVYRFNLKGLSQPRYYRRLAKFSDSTIETNGLQTLIEGDNGSYSESTEKNLAVIRYKQFGGKDKDFIDSAFALAKSGNIEKLILDLRDNRGGSTSVYETIVSHLTKDTIMMFANVEYKISHEFLST